MRPSVFARVRAVALIPLTKYLKQNHRKFYRKKVKNRSCPGQEDCRNIAFYIIKIKFELCSTAALTLGGQAADYA
jgi:hypothetical protein